MRRSCVSGCSVMFRPFLLPSRATRTLWPVLIALCGAFAAASPALAQRGSRSIVPDLDDSGRRGEIARIAEKRAEERFDRADANGDGRLTEQELSVTAPYMAENFKTYDKNEDGFLNWEEFVGHDRWKRSRK